MPHSYQVNDNTKKISRKKFTKKHEGLPKMVLFFVALTTITKLARMNLIFGVEY